MKRTPKTTTQERNITINFDLVLKVGITQQLQAKDSGASVTTTRTEAAFFVSHKETTAGSNLGNPKTSDDNSLYAAVHLSGKMPSRRSDPVKGDGSGPDNQSPRTESRPSTTINSGSVHNKAEENKKSKSKEKSSTKKDALNSLAAFAAAYSGKGGGSSSSSNRSSSSSTSSRTSMLSSTSSSSTFEYAPLEDDGGSAASHRHYDLSHHGIFSHPAYEDGSSASASALASDSTLAVASSTTRNDNSNEGRDRPDQSYQCRPPSRPRKQQRRHSRHRSPDVDEVLSRVLGIVEKSLERKDSSSSKLSPSSKNCSPSPLSSPTPHNSLRYCSLY